MKPESFILNWRQKLTMEWHHPQPPRQTIRVFTSGQVYDHCLLGCEGEILWLRCREGRQSAPKLTSGRWQNTRSRKNGLYFTRIKKNPSLLWKCKAIHKFEDSEGYHKIWLDSVKPSSPQLRSSTLTFLPTWSLQECTLIAEMETDDYMISVVSIWLHEQEKTR